MLKKLLFLCVAVIFVTAFSQVAYGLEVLYENRTREQISRGMVYERNRMMISNGMLDVHVLTVDLNEPHIYIRPITSIRGLSLRETTSRLVRDSGAVAGINADFFNMSGLHSLASGPVAVDGELHSAITYTNFGNNQYATFLMDMHNNVFFRYMHFSIGFYNNGVRNVVTGALNNVGQQLNWAVVLNRNALYDTSSIDERFPNTTKIIVEGHTISRVSQPGETVTIPENGYVVLLPESMNYRRYRFAPGQLADLVIRNDAGVNFSQIQAAVGGGGLLLSNGAIVEDYGTPAGRHPRAAVGISSDGNRLILMVADGRTHSVGATHANMAELMRRYGAHNAMHFDSGGSATLVVSDRGENHAVANTPSEGTERRVINALGVFDESLVGPLARIVIEPEAARAVVGLPVFMSVSGEDAKGNRVPINAQNLRFSVNDEFAGFWNNNGYTAFRAGAHLLTAAYGDFTANVTITAHILAELQPNLSAVSLVEGERVSLNFSGVTQEGFTVAIPSVAGLSVSPAHLGRIENNIFIAAAGGAGYITATVGAVNTFIPVTVGGSPVAIDMHSGQISQLSHPATGVTTVRTENVDNRRAIRMDYNFAVSQSTQAAYVTFNPPLNITAAPVGLRLQVRGDGSGHWLRGRVRDGSGQIHLIDFTRNANFTGWQTVTATMPNAPGPFTIDQIYMVTLSSSAATSNTVFFYRLEALYVPVGQATVPRSTQFVDSMRATGGIAGATVYEFNVPVEVSYSIQRRSNFAVVTMTAREGGISATNRSQWGTFMNDLRANNPAHAVVILDMNPLEFTQPMEFELFHLAMQELLAEGRNVFVVSSGGSETVLTMRDGVRYISLARPGEGPVQMRFQTRDGNVWWG